MAIPTTTNEFYYALIERVELLKASIKGQQDALTRYLRDSIAENTEGIDYRFLIDETRKTIGYRQSELSLVDALISHIRVTHIIFPAKKVQKTAPYP